MALRVVMISRASASASVASHCWSRARVRSVTSRTPASADSTTATTSSGTERPEATAAPSAARSPYSPPSTVMSAFALSREAGTAVQSIRNREFCRPPWAASNCSRLTGRKASFATLTTGSPCSPATSTRSAFSPAEAIRTRTRARPVSPSRTPAHENGSPTEGPSP